MRFSRILLAAAWVLFATGSQAGTPLRIATIDGPPWGFVGSDGKPTGMMFEISNRIAQEAGFTYSNQLTPYARIAPEMAHGKTDFVLRFSSEEMVEVANPVAVVVTMPVIAIGPEGSRFKVLEDLRGKTVGVVRKSRYTDAFDNDPLIRKYEADNYLQIVRMLKMKRLDAGVGGSAGLLYSAYMAGLRPGELGVPLVIGSNDFVLHFSKTTANPETMSALSLAVKRLNQRGDIKKIIDSYMGDYRFDIATVP
jgi:polar amino acid transport system substrate-binding protein